MFLFSKKFKTPILNTKFLNYNTRTLTKTSYHQDHIYLLKSSYQINFPYYPLGNFLFPSLEIPNLHTVTHFCAKTPWKTKEKSTHHDLGLENFKGLRKLERKGRKNHFLEKWGFVKERKTDTLIQELYIYLNNTSCKI